MAMQLETATSPFPDASLDQDDVVYPCKGCGEILEEGKAFELAGNRWHIDCFRCNTCGTLLDSDANLLLLGDGSLICNNCTYSCSACNNKIEDLAILTGDQAFCANCFRCRNCKRKIDNLRYARTSQGIFCMSCHESLMARRRKNKKASRNPVPARDGLNKSLPSLPPPGVTREEFEALDGDTLQDEQLSSSVYSATASSTRQTKRTTDGARPSISREVSSPSFNDDSRRTTIDDQTLLPASTFGRVNNNDNRTSSNSKTLSYADDGAAMFGSVPFMLDPQDTLMEEASPLSRSSDYVEAKSKPERATSRDYFGRAPTAGSQRNSSMRETMQESSRRSSVEGAREASPHIASQAREQDRKPSDHISEAMKQRTSARTSQQTTPSIASPAPQQTPQNESGFKLQDAPRPRKTSTSQRTSEQEARSSAASTPVIDQIERPSGRNVPTPRGNDRDRNIDAPPRLVERISYVSDDWPSPGVASPRSIQQTLSKEVERPKRGDSLAAATLKPVSRKEVGSASTSGPTTPTVPQPTHGRDTSLSSSSHNGSRLGHHPVESPESTSKTAFEPPPRAASRPNMMRNEPSDSSKDVFTMPRVPPPAPPNNIARHGPSASLASMSSMRSDMSQSTQKSPNLPPGSTGGDFSMAEELERIMQEGGNEEANMRSQTSVLRKVSNAVKHGRSFSDRPARSERSSQSNSRDWPKSPLNGSMEISSPTSATSPATAHEENVLLKNRLRQAQDRISRLEVEKNGLQELVTNNVDISQVNTELRQKRSTMAILDTQREVVVRELEVMTDHLKRAKDTNRALDLNELKSGINRDFAASLQKLKDSLGQEIEKLMQKRADLGREIDDLIQMKDKGFEEYEALSTRNHQLSKHNNELIQSIQGNMKASAHHQHGEHGNSFDGGRQPPNGLGLYIAQNSRQGMRQEQQADVRHLQDSSTDYSQTTIITDPDADPIVVASPQVIKIGKGKANVFKKGTQGFVKGLRNVRKEFASERTDRSTERNNSLPYSNSLESTQGTPYGSMSQGQGPESGSRVDMQPYNRATPTEQPRQRIGDFFRGQGGNEKTHLRHLKQGNNGSFQNLAESAGNANLIFGIQLTTRCEYEKRFVPYIVTRCIEEVELRGMDVEGIYRKSGGTGQVNQIRAGFERDNDFDISDPELDIHAVTSALKQFLRKLPMPLISYDVYEDLLDCARIEDQRARAQPMKEAIQGLPKAHRDCLEFLMFHLAKVMAQEKQNLMTPLNLAVVFAPTIMRPQSIEREMQDMQLQRVAVQSILEMNQIIFGYDT